MHFASLGSVALCLASAIAQSTSSGANPFSIPQGGYALTAGKASTITWKPTTSGTVTLTLRSGASSDLNKGTVIASSIPNSGSYTYTPPADTVRNSDYTIEISSDSSPSDVNYTPQFVIESTNTVESMSGASSAGASMTSANSMASSMASSAMSTAMSASSGSASSKASSMTGSKTSMGSSSSTGSSSTGGTSSTGSTTAAPAPSSGAVVKNVVNGGLAMAAVGVALVL